MRNEITTNKITNVERPFWSYVRCTLRDLELRFLESEIYEIDGTMYRSFMWFSHDNGQVCRLLCEHMNAGFTNTRNGEEVA